MKSYIILISLLLFTFSFIAFADEKLNREREQFFDWRVNAVNKQIKLSKSSIEQTSEHQIQITEDILHDHLQQNVIDATQVIIDAN